LNFQPWTFNSPAAALLFGEDRDRDPDEQRDEEPVHRDLEQGNRATRNGHSAYCPERVHQS
jgi:hypothetical protein